MCTYTKTLVIEIYKKKVIEIYKFLLLLKYPKPLNPQKKTHLFKWHSNIRILLADIMGAPRNPDLPLLQVDKPKSHSKSHTREEPDDASTNHCTNRYPSSDNTPG